MVAKRLFSGAAIAAFSGAALVAVFSVSGVLAGPNDNELVIDGKEIPTKVKAPEGSPFEYLYSGWRYRSPETQAVQADDFENPAFPLIEQGEELWSKVDGTEGKSCASCHNDASESMKGVRAQMPKWNETAGKPMTLEQFVNGCRTTRMGAEAWKWDSQPLLAMTSFIGLQSRGMPQDPKIDGPMKAWHDKGKEIYYERTGQLDLSCASCHEENNGKRIRADHLSQGHINGFPTFRFKWQGVGSLHKRFFGCMRDVRATPYEVGSDEFVALELYTAARGKGLSIETPAVRQ